VYLANRACITPHVWLSRADRPDHSNQLIFDLDPDGDEFEQARMAALWLRSLLEELGLPSFARTTRNKGIHLTVSLDRRDDFDTMRAFVREVAEELAGRHPDRAHHRAAQGPAVRGRDAQRLRTDRGAALRGAGQAGRHGGRTAGLERGRGPLAPPSRFTIGSILDRLEQADDPWRDLRRRRRSHSQAHKRLNALIDEG
jgi:bifunctional non-homologous end joining protein LigD